MTIPVRAAAELVGPHVKISVGNGALDPKLMRILSLVNAYAWKKGVWVGQTAQFTVPVNGTTGEIVCPPDYNVLLKININSKPTPLRNQQYEFHRNGTGSKTECCGDGWSNQVVFQGVSPVFRQPRRDESCQCCPQDCGCYRIAVSCDGIPCTDDGLVHVKGYHERVENRPEKKVYSHVKRTTNHCVVRRGSEEPASDEELIEGVRFPIKDSFVVIEDVCWSRITEITKTISDHHVDVWAVNDEDRFFHVARLEPHQLNSEYRRYLVPTICQNAPCVHGLFKRTKPHSIVSEAQSLIFDDEEALIAMAMGVNKMFFNDDVEGAVPFLARGISCLNEIAVETEGMTDTPLEVVADDFTCDDDDVNFSA